MQAVILVGGFGTRLRPLTWTTPKPLLPILNKPMITYIIDSLPRGVDEVILAVNYKASVIERFVKENDLGVSVRVVPEPEPLGTGGAIKNSERYIDGAFFVINGDVMSSLDLGKMRSFHVAKKGIATIASREVEDPSHFGVMELARGRRITSFVEKPKPGESKSRLINAGVYILEAEVFDHIEANKPVSVEREVFPALIGLGMYNFEFRGHWIDVGRPETYLEINRMLLKSRGKSKRGALKSRKAAATSVLGRGCTVAKDAVIGPYACLGNNVSVGRGAKVKNSIVMDKCQIGQNASITGSIIGYSCTIGDNSVIEDGCVIGDKYVVESGAVVPKNSKRQVQ